MARGRGRRRCTATPSSRATQATPCAMFPALVVQTPRRHSSGSACRIALAAPRILNEPIGWRHSSLSQISASARRPRAARAACGSPCRRSASAARSIASREIRTRSPSRVRARVLGPRASSAAARSSTARPSDLNSVSSSSSRRPGCAPIRSSPSSARMWSGPMPALGDRTQVVAGLVQGRLAPVDEERGAATTSASSSRAHVPDEPTALTCAPGAQSGRWSRVRIGSDDGGARAHDVRAVDAPPRRTRTPLRGPRARAPRRSPGSGSRPAARRPAAPRASRPRASGPARPSRGSPPAARRAGRGASSRRRTPRPCGSR